MSEGKYSQLKLMAHVSLRAYIIVSANYLNL